MPTPMFHTAGAELALSGSGAYARSEIISVAERKLVCLQLAYDAAASSGYPVILPLVSFAETQPAAADDAWFAVPSTDGMPVSTVLAGALPAGSDFTLAAGVGLVNVLPLAIKPMGASGGASEELRGTVTIDLTSVPGARWFMFAVAEVGATPTPGSLLVTATVG